LKSGKEGESVQRIMEKLQKHWLIVLISMAAALVVGTWKVCRVLYVDPRDHELSILREQLLDLRQKVLNCPQVIEPNPIVLSETGVFEGTAATTIDGVCQIAIGRVVGANIDLTVAMGGGKPEIFKGIHPGDRITQKFMNGSYFIDIHRIRGDIVDLTVSKSQP
jgi:hypothetical protein